MGGFPALMIRPPESPVQQIGQAMQVQQLAGQQQLQQQQIQGAQTANQGSQIELQMKQLALKNMQISQTALSDPNLSSDFEKWQQAKGQSTGEVSDTASTPGTGDSPLGLHPIAQFLAETKGLPMVGPGGAIEMSQNITKNAQAVADLQKTGAETKKAQLETYGEQVGNLVDRAEPVFTETDPSKQQSALDMFKLQVKMSPSDFPPEVVSRLNQINSAGDLAPLVNSGKMHQAIIDEGTKLATEQSTAANAAIASRKASGVTEPELNDIKNTINQYSAIPAPMRQAFSKELDSAGNRETVQTIQARADAAQESFQRSQDAMANAKSLKDVAVGQAMAGQLVNEDKTLTGSLNQTQGIRGLLDMSKGGDQTATAAAQTRFAEHEIVEGGVKRLNQLELEQLTNNLGDYGRQFQAWYDKGFSGKMPAATNAEMAKILDAEDAVSHVQHDQNVSNVENRFSQISGGGINPRAAQTNGMIRARDPNGILHEAKAGTPLPAGWKPE